MAAAKQPTLTPKQRKFSKLVASGLPKVQAYDRVYSSRGGNRESRMVASQKLAQHPNVQATIAKYEEQYAPIGDFVREQMDVLANIKWLSQESPDHRVRLMASVKLHELLEEHRIRQRAKHTDHTADALIGELLEISGPVKQTIELEAVDQQAETQNAQDEAAATEAANAGEEPDEENEGISDEDADGGDS